MITGLLLFAINLLCAIYNFGNMSGATDSNFYAGCFSLSVAFWILGVWMGREF